MKRIGKHRALFVMMLAGFTLLSLVVMIQQLGAAPLPSPAKEERPFLLSPTATTYTGWLTVIWGDGLPGTASLSPLYRLTLEDGQTINLQPTDATVTLPEWAGKQVSVNGEFANGRSTNNTFVVTAVTPLQARGLDDDILGPQPWVSLLCKFADYPNKPEEINYFKEK